MRLVLVFTLLLAGCGSLTRRPSEQVDSVLKQRLEQVEGSMDSLKSEAIAEARGAAADLVEDATKKLEDSGKEVISHAADEMDAVLTDRLDQVGEIIEQRQLKATADIKSILKEDVPESVENSIVNSADKIAERLGVVRKTTPGPDGEDYTIWGIGGAGLLGAVFTVIRNMMNRMKDKKRWTPEELKRAIDSHLSNK